MINNSYNLGQENPLLAYLRNYMPQQQPNPEPERVSGDVNAGAAIFEIDSKLDIEYIEPDKSGRRQIFICDKENRIYLGRYNHVRKKTDYRAYIDEGEIKLSANNDATEGISKIAEALVAVVNKLEAMQGGIDSMKNEISDIKDSTTKTIVKEDEKLPFEDVEIDKPKNSRKRNPDGTYAKGGARR